MAALTDIEIENWAVENLSKETAELELWRRWMRHMCRENLWFLSVEVLGYRAFDPEFHGRMCRRLNRWPTNIDGTPLLMTADAWPRGGFKTTLATIARAIQMFLRCPEETFMIEHGTDDGAMKIGREIRDHFENNQLLRWLFPDLIWADPKADAPKWTQNEIILPRKGRYKEATFTFTSQEKETTGGHYTKQFFDDLVCEGNTGTAEAMDSAHTHWIRSQAKKDMRSKEDMNHFAYPWLPKDYEVHFGIANVFTMWDIRDSNARYTNPANPEYEMFKDHVSVCIEKAIRADGTSFFPARFPLHELERMRLQWGDAWFSAQMQQDPYPEGTQVFNPKLLQRWTENTLPKTLWYYTAVDPNGIPKDGQSKGDCGVVMTIGVSPLGTICIMRIDRKRFSPSEQIKALLDHYTLFNPKKIVIETTAYQSTFAYWLKEETKHLDIHLPIVPRPRGGADAKEKRIKSIDPHWTAKRIAIAAGEPNTKEFVAEASRWTGKKTDQDDMLDALSDAIWAMKKPPLVGEDRAKAIKAGIVEPEPVQPQHTGRTILELFEKKRNARRPVAELRRQRITRMMKTTQLWAAPNRLGSQKFGA